jgi:SAM-dependent methyltransferase
LIRRLLCSLAPRSLREYVRVARQWVPLYRKLLGAVVLTCPSCGYRGPFRAYGDPPRLDALCPGCESLERHRLLCLATAERGLFQGGRALHFAPEPAVTRFVRPCVERYDTADIAQGRADQVLDLEDIRVPDACYDWVIASHVLEHVDDRKALAELRRILRPGGVLVAMVPIVEGWEHTYENEAVTTPQQRVLHFGQSDHVRWYGRDFRDRVRTAGFELEEWAASPQACIEHGLARGERVFVCRRG